MNQAEVSAKLGDGARAGLLAPMRAEINIRPASLADLHQLAELEHLCFAAPANRPWKRAELGKELEDGSIPARLFLVAARDDQLLGYILFALVLDEAELLRMAVKPSSRRQGVARRLLEAGLERLELAGINRCQLEVRADNQAAIGLYQATGFGHGGRRRSYYPDGTDALLMQRESSI